MPNEIQYVIDQEFVNKIGNLSKICIEDQENLLNSIKNVINLIQELDQLSSLDIPAEDNKYTVSLDEIVVSDDEVDLDHTAHLTKYFTHFKEGYFIVPSYIQE